MRRRITTTLEDDLKPLLRGWLHAGGALLGLGFTFHLFFVLGEEGWSVLLFGLASILLFGISAVYHLGDGHWSKSTAKVLAKLDHCAIFILIASTTTPFCDLALEGPLGTVMMGLTWTLAAGGVAVTLPSWRVPRWLKTGLYVVMGWSAVAIFPALQGRFDWLPIIMIVASGVIYTLGAFAYARRGPKLLPRVFGYHEVFHLATLVANGLLAAVIYRWLIPLT